MNKKILKMFCVLISVISILPLSMVFAAKPILNNDVWFVGAPRGPPIGGQSWWTGDETIFHLQGYMQSFGIFRSSPNDPPGTIEIGSMTAMMETFVFNTKTSKGRLVHKVIISLIETDTLLNPYGVGTLEGSLIVEVTSLHPNGFPGDGEGFVVATQGTGAFENAKLNADVLMMKVMDNGRVVVMTFFGTHWNIEDGLGIIVYH